MNDNEPLGEFGVPAWAEAIIERNDLGLRADSPLSATTVLLADAAVNLKDVAITAFQEQAITRETLSIAQACLEVLTDAIKLARLCPDKPENGKVEESEDGTLTWSPDP